MEREMRIMNFLKRITSGVKRVLFVNGKMSYIILRGCWCYTDLNIHAPTRDIIYDMKSSLYKELACALDKFPKCHM
jgi:hypothetical protein